MAEASQVETVTYLRRCVHLKVPGFLQSRVTNFFLVVGNLDFDIKSPIFFLLAPNPYV